MDSKYKSVLCEIFLFAIVVSIHIISMIECFIVGVTDPEFFSCRSFCQIQFLFVTIQNPIGS